MELQKQPAPFTAPRATRIVSTDGSMCMNFEAGQTRDVPSKMFSEAVAAGLIPEGRLEGYEAPAVVKVDAVAEKPPTKQEKIFAGVLEACKTLIARGNPADFTQMGSPRTSSVKKLVDFDFTAQDVRRAFEQAMFEVEQDGNNSTEPTEPSSSTAE